MTADATATYAEVSVLMANTAIGVASDKMLGADDVEFQKQDQQQVANPANLPVVLKENAVGGINRVMRICIIVIYFTLIYGVGFFMISLVGQSTYNAILALLSIPFFAMTWALPNDNNNHDLWWWQRWGRAKVILMASLTCFSFNCLLSMYTAV